MEVDIGGKTEITDFDRVPEEIDIWMSRLPDYFFLINIVYMGIG